MLFRLLFALFNLITHLDCVFLLVSFSPAMLIDAKISAVVDKISFCVTM